MVMVLNLFTIKYTAIFVCRKALEKVRSIKFSWVQDLGNVAGSEAAYELAKRGSKSINIEVENLVRQSLCNFFREKHENTPADFS